MALMKSREIPQDAVALSEVEATSYAWEIVTDWDSLSDTWALRYGPAVLGGISAVSGLLINSHYRQKLKVGRFGYLASTIPISVMPGLLSTLFHRHLISTSMLLMKQEACPICYEIKSAVVQCGFGILYPMALAPTAALMMAHRYNTYRTPSLLEPKVMFQFLRKLTKPLHGPLMFLGAVHFVASSVITYFEMKNNVTVRTKIMEIEKKVLADSGEVTQM